MEDLAGLGRAVENFLDLVGASIGTFGLHPVPKTPS